jgi:hypothetical protein
VDVGINFVSVAVDKFLNPKAIIFPPYDLFMTTLPASI